MFSLHHNFFYKLKDIQNINFEIWTKMNLPMNLFFILQGKIALCKPENSNLINPINPFELIEPIQTQGKNTPQVKQTAQTAQTLQTTQANSTVIQTQKSNEQMERFSDLTEKERQYADDQKLKVGISNILKLIKMEVGEISLAREVFKTIHNLVCNILQNPEDKKYRRINLGAIMKKFPYKNIKDLVELFQFKQAEDSEVHVEFNSTIEYLNKCTEIINLFLIENSKQTV